MDVVIFVVDSTDKERLSIVKEELLTLVSGIKNKNFCLLLLLNKQDCPNIIDECTILEEIDLLNLQKGDIIV